MKRHESETENVLFEGKKNIFIARFSEKPFNLKVLSKNYACLWT